MTTKEKIEVMQAYEEGKAIECNNKRDSDWFELDQPDWNWSGYDYRLKKEKQPLTREEITAQWVRDNDVKVFDFVKYIGDSTPTDSFIVFNHLHNYRLPIVSIQKEYIVVGDKQNSFSFNVEELKKATKRIEKFCFEDRELFRDKWVKTKGSFSCTEFLITFIGDEKIKVGSDFYTYDEALEMLQFIDGKPFGKEIWE